MEIVGEREWGFLIIIQGNLIHVLAEPFRYCNFLKVKIGEQLCVHFM